MAQLFEKALQFLHQELSHIRTGRATPSLVEDIRADYYGTPTPLKQLGSIAASEPMVLTIQIWDVTALQAAEKALRSSNLNINPVVDGQIIRIPFPPLSEERRQEFVKIVKQKAEAARVSVRAIREEGMKKIKDQENAKELSEDAADGERKEMQKQVDTANKEIDHVVEEKEQEILRI